MGAKGDSLIDCPICNEGNGSFRLEKVSLLYQIISVSVAGEPHNLCWSSRHLYHTA